MDDLPKMILIKFSGQYNFPWCLYFGNGPYHLSVLVYRVVWNTLSKSYLGDNQRSQSGAAEVFKVGNN